MGPKRRKQATKATAIVPRGPNHHLNALREHLEAQICAEATLAATNDPGVQDALMRDINNRTSVNRHSCRLCPKSIHQQACDHPQQRTKVGIERSSRRSSQ